MFLHVSAALDPLNCHFFAAKVSHHGGGRFKGGRWGDRSCPRKLYWNILRSSVLRGAFWGGKGGKGGWFLYYSGE